MKPELLLIYMMFNSATCNMSNLEMLTVRQAGWGSWTYSVSYSWVQACAVDNTDPKCETFSYGSDIWLGEIDLSILKEAPGLTVSGSVTLEWDEWDKPEALNGIWWEVCAYPTGDGRTVICETTLCPYVSPEHYDVTFDFDAMTRHWTAVTPCGANAP